MSVFLEHLFSKPTKTLVQFLTRIYLFLTKFTTVFFPQDSAVKVQDEAQGPKAVLPHHGPGEHCKIFLLSEN